MRIAHISTQRGWGGGEQQAALLIAGLASRGHRSLVLARAGGEFAQRMAAVGVECGTFAGGGRNPGALWQLRRQLAAWRPDVVHFHDAHALSGGGLACWRLPIAARIVSRKVMFPVRHAWRYRQFADRVICVSQAVAECCRASGLPADRLRVVYDGLDPALVEAASRARGRESVRVSPDELLMLSVGSLSNVKGHRHLLAALRSVVAMYPQVRLAIAGDGPLEESLRRRANELGLAGVVRFLGYRRDVPDLVRAADLFVLPSLMEGMCSTLIDVMIARCPIVASAVGGVPEVLGANASTAPAPVATAPIAPVSNVQPLGRLVPPADEAALATAICESIAGLADSAAQLNRAREHALRHFTAERMVEATLSVYRDVLAA
ncbi:MAG TPA: glycosyltransferase, partial [Pirellulales bacterium]|nr:glycosyltransferase [Pirellulales bacterium]